MSIRGAAVSILSLALLGCGAGTAKLRPAPQTLAACDRARCVSSQQPETGYYIPPLSYIGSREAAYERLRSVVVTMPGARIETASADYIHATFTSRLLRFVDDLELLFADTGGVVHVRSSSRLGYSDFGVNRARVERLRAAFERAER